MARVVPPRMTGLRWRRKFTIGLMNTYNRLAISFRNVPKAGR
jgi:hypothetical protein